MYLHFLTQSVADYFSGLPEAGDMKDRKIDDDIHLQAATSWLNRSIAQCDGQASSKAYRFARGWMPPYPETSGYIIPTLLTLGDLHDDQTSIDTARRIGRFLVDMQGADGGFVGCEADAAKNPIVFDTGMILLGLTSLINRGEGEPFRTAALRAGDFLLGCMDDTGCFARNLSNDIIHTYNVRAAWGLMALSKATGEQKYADGALRNADWTLRQQLDNGFFENNIFKPDGNANLHGISYVMRGLLEISMLSGRKDLRKAVELTADRLVALFRERGYIAGEIDPDWRYLSRYLCLTGYAQLAIILLKLHENNGNTDYLTTAHDLIDVVASTQNITDKTQPHFGGVKGSHPFYGRYAPLQYPNWATKFFIDSLLEKKRIASQQALPNSACG